MEYDGKTPWGTYHKAYYYDKNRKACDKENAYEMHIHEYDEKGEFIQDTIAIIGNKENSDL